MKQLIPLFPYPTSVPTEAGGCVGSLTGTRLHSTDNERVRTENPNPSMPQTLSATIHYVVSQNIKHGVERKTQAIAVFTCRALVADLGIHFYGVHLATYRPSLSTFNASWSFARLLTVISGLVCSLLARFLVRV